jgi:hypothetical protein
VPIKVGFLDQRDLPIAAPFLQLLLTSDRRCYAIKNLEIDQPCKSISFGKTGHSFASVLMCPANQIVGHAYIKRFMSTVCTM